MFELRTSFIFAKLQRKIDIKYNLDNDTQRSSIYQMLLEQVKLKKYVLSLVWINIDLLLLNAAAEKRWKTWSRKLGTWTRWRRSYSARTPKHARHVRTSLLSWNIVLWFWIDWRLLLGLHTIISLNLVYWRFKSRMRKRYRRCRDKSYLRQCWREVSPWELRLGAHYYRTRCQTSVG